MDKSEKSGIDHYIDVVNFNYPREWLESREVADVLGIHPEILYRNRIKQEGIPFLKIGKKVIYLKKDVIDYLRESYVLTNNKVEK